MDWKNRGERQAQPTNHTASHAGVGPVAHPAQARRKRDSGFVKAAATTLLITVSILLVAVLVYSLFGAKTNSDGKYVDTGKYQAVFLNGGQVYFGHIKTLNNKYLRVDNIYYLRVNQQVQPNQANSQSSNDVSLVKLGCELHGPDDQMVINREQVIFWENLKSDGQVGKAIAEFVKTNPNGQKCDTTTTSTTPTTTTPATKK